MSTSNTGRKAAQRIYVATECKNCGSTKTLQRHHKDRNPLNNAPENIEILCRTCHKNEHLRDGTWGRGLVAPAICEICRSPFQPKRNRRKGRVLCGDPKCLSEIGRRAALKRWSAGQQQE